MVTTAMLVRTKVSGNQIREVTYFRDAFIYYISTQHLNVYRMFTKVPENTLHK
jgi:hypothetical protein